MLGDGEAAVVPVLPRLVIGKQRHSVSRLGGFLKPVHLRAWPGFEPQLGPGNDILVELRHR